MQTRDEIIAEFTELQSNPFGDSFDSMKLKTKHKRKSKPKSRRNNKKKIPIFIDEFTTNQVYSNQALIGKIILDPLKLTAIHFILEDDFESVISVSVYSDNDINKYQKGTKLCINNPFYKVAGDGKYHIRIDEASNHIQILSETTAIGKEKSALDWKNLGNQCYQNKNYKYSEQCYSRGVSCFVSDGIITSLLNNRALCHMKVKQFKLALADIIASKCINPSVYKTWHIQILCLAKLNQQKTAFGLWEEAMKLFAENKNKLKILKKQSFAEISNGNGSKSEWDVLGVIVNDICTDIVSETEKLSAEEWKEIGNKEFQRNNYEKAIEYYTVGLVTHYKTLSVLFSNRAASLICLREDERAFRDATMSVIMDANNMKGWFRRAIMAFELNFDAIGDSVCRKYETENVTFKRLMDKFRSNQNNNDSLNNEEKKIQIEKEAKGDTLSNTQLSQMNQLMSMLPANIREKCGYGADIPRFHELFRKKRRYPKHADVNKCNDILFGAYEHAISMGMHNLHLLSDEFELTPYDIIKRLGAPDDARLKWYCSGALGVVDENHYKMLVNVGYNPGASHSFSNAPDNNIIIYSGHTHIAVGFCDLGLLTKCTIRSSDQEGAVRFIGIDMSVHSIAKTYVITQMLANKSISNASVLEVWYSATWTKQTQIDFYHTLAVIVKMKDRKIENKIYKYIRHWFDSKGVSVKKARKLWFDSLTDVFEEIGTFNKINDILDYAEYIISGDIIRQNEMSVCGNVTMFDNIKTCPKKAKNENIYQIIEMNKLFARSYKTTKSLKETVRLTLESNIEQLKSWIVNKEVIIEFMHGEVSLSNGKLIQRLKDMKPYSVSWSNCIDYINPSKFHKIAKTIGNKDCVHFAYSMNWNLSINGCNIIDYDDLEVRKTLFETSKSAVKMSWSLLGIDEILRFPPIANPINVGSYGMNIVYGKIWVKWFLSKQVAKCDVNYNEEGIMHVLYSPLHRTHTVMRFAWAYDESLNLLAPTITNV